MSSDLHESLVRVAPFGVGVLVLGLLSAVRPKVRERLAWNPVPGGVLVRWLLLWAVWLVVTELVTNALGRPAPAPFAARGAALAVRLLGIVVLAPLLEELAFRGALFGLLRPRLGAGPTVGVTALLFTIAHVQYGAPELIQVFLDGVLFGLARLRTGSTRVPFCMHVLGNALAAWQRLGPG